MIIWHELLLSSCQNTFTSVRWNGKYFLGLQLPLACPDELSFSALSYLTCFLLLLTKVIFGVSSACYETFNVFCLFL